MGFSAAQSQDICRDSSAFYPSPLARRSSFISHQQYFVRNRLNPFSGKMTLSCNHLSARDTNRNPCLWFITHKSRILYSSLPLPFKKKRLEPLPPQSQRCDVSQFCLWESVPRLQAYHCPLLLSNPLWSCLQPRVLSRTSPSCSCSIQVPYLLLPKDTIMQKLFLRRWETKSYI